MADDNIVTMNWLYSNAVGGVKVQVPEQEVDHAIDVLDRADHGIDSTLSQPGEVICMSCGSSDVFYEKRPRIVTFLSFFLFCIPLPFFKARWKCGKCEKTWPA